MSADGRTGSPRAEVSEPVTLSSEFLFTEAPGEEASAADAAHTKDEAFSERSEGHRTGRHHQTPKYETEEDGTKRSHRIEVR